MPKKSESTSKRPVGRPRKSPAPQTKSKPESSSSISKPPAPKKITQEKPLWLQTPKNPSPGTSAIADYIWGFKGY